MTNIKTLFNCSEEILCAQSKKIHVGEISCDLAKASDSVNHETLLPKLSFYGI
jgi:hypothetical protein